MMAIDSRDSTSVYIGSLAFEPIQKVHGRTQMGVYWFTAERQNVITV
jgi:hypothetical protein